jgi:hypothetical protein
MPAVLIVDDDGREIFRGALSAENLDVVGAFFARHIDTFRGLAAFKRALDQAMAAHVAAVGPEPPAPRPRRRRR